VQQLGAARVQQLGAALLDFRSADDLEQWLVFQAPSEPA
jgi:hypothetical protein